MFSSLSPTSNLKKFQDLPPISYWAKDRSVAIFGHLTLYTRNYGILDKVSSECRRPCVLTRNGDFIIYMNDKKGFVLDLHSSVALRMENDKARQKYKTVLIKRCKVKICFKFGTITVTLYEEEIARWRDGILAVLEGTDLPPIVETKMISPPVVRREKSPPKQEEEEDINSSLYDITSDMDHETYTVISRRTEHHTAKSEVVPHSDLLSDPPTPPNTEPEKREEEPIPNVNQASFPPHRTANIAFIRPHPSRHLPVFIPPSDVPLPNPHRFNLSKISVLDPPPSPRRSKIQSIGPSPDINRSLRKVSRAKSFKSEYSNDSTDSQMPYYRKIAVLAPSLPPSPHVRRSKYVQRSPHATMVSNASIELTAHSDKKSFIRSPLPREFMEEKSSPEMCAHLEDPVRSYIKQCYEQTLKDSRETSPRSITMDNKISFFERVVTDTVSANRCATMPRKVSRMAVNGRATLPRSTSSRASFFDMDFSKDSSV